MVKTFTYIWKDLVDEIVHAHIMCHDSDWQYAVETSQAQWLLLWKVFSTVVSANHWVEPEVN